MTIIGLRNWQKPYQKAISFPWFLIQSFGFDLSSFDWVQFSRFDLKSKFRIDLISGNDTNDALIQSLKSGADKLSNQNNFYFIHLSLIKEIISAGDRNFWDCDFIRNVIRQFSNSNAFDGSAVVMNALFMLYYELEKKDFPYEDEEAVQKALHLLSGDINLSLKVTICNYLDKIFERRYNACWAFAIVELLKMAISPDIHSNGSVWRKRLSQFLLHDPSLISAEQSQEIFVLAKSLTSQSEHIIISDLEIMSTNFHFSKLLAELIGHTKLIKVVWSTPNLRLLDLVQLEHYFDNVSYFDRGLSILRKERNGLSLIKFISSLKNPSIDTIASLYDALEFCNMINAMILDALLQKSEAWNLMIIPILASEAIEKLSSPKWEFRDNALSYLTVLVKYGYNGHDLTGRISDMAKNDEEPYIRREALIFLNQIGNQDDVTRVAAHILLSDSDSSPRIEAVQVLQDGLPQTEKLCLDLIPKILYDEDIALHRRIINLCANLITGSTNQELKDLLMKFLEDEVDCYEELNELLNGRSKGLSLQQKDSDDLEYIFNVLALQDEEEFDKDCYDL
uniref:Uncharacterized protein n=1 Tax=Setaria digitata TaxID=48799 RepID=A0A915Q6E5_9BILA